VLVVAGGVVGGLGSLGGLVPPALGVVPLGLDVLPDPVVLVLVDQVLDDGGVAALLGEQEPRHGVDADAEAAEEGGDGEHEAQDVGVDTDVLTDAGADAGDDPAVPGALELLGRTVDVHLAHASTVPFGMPRAHRDYPWPYP
jgi:hypothetical protein